MPQTMSRNPRDGEFARVCALLPTLTPAELEQVRLRVGFLGEPGGEPVAGRPARDDDHDWLLRGIEDELRRRGLLGATARLPAAKLVPTWAKISLAVRADLDRAVARGGRWRHPQVALGRCVARALASWLVAGRIRVTPRTMLQNVDKIMVALDDAFPGYVEAGLLHCALDPGLAGAE